MIAGPASVYICDSCVRVCKTIIDRELGEKSAPPKGSDEKPVFNLQRPSVIKGFLDQHVIGQEHAKKVLSAIVTLQLPHIPVPSIIIGFNETSVDTPYSLFNLTTNFIIISGPIATV